VVIGVRGEGRLLSGDQTWTIRPFDLAYVPPQRVHQLQNPGAEPFGFFCIVDHLRDRPQPP
jgi:ribulose-bisphosphate carboxylase large chain